MFAREPAEAVILDRAIVDQPGFKRGDLIWAITYQATSPDGKISGSFEIVINSRTAVAVSNTNSKPRSLSKYLVTAQGKVERGNEAVAPVIAAQAQDKKVGTGKVELPKVETDYAEIGKRGNSAGKKLADLIPPKTIRRIVLTHDHGLKDLSECDALVARLFQSSAEAKQWGLSATESKIAEFVVVTEAGDLYRLAILRDFSPHLTACLLYAKGYACRFAIAPPDKKK